MKQYYESELIKEIVEARGHKKSSLHYESECAESWIEEAKGAYPKLCDYQSEWLNYISILDDMGGGEDPEPPIGEFPYVVLSDVTEATIDNVVPYAYKSAILKGQTLVNIKGKESNDFSMPGYPKYDFLIPLVKKNTDYLIKYDTTTDGVLAVGFLKDKSSWSNNLEQQPDAGLIRLNSGQYPNYFRITAGRGQTLSINNLLIVEYKEGMENWDIPYFEGMQSVKMPVLTTSNEDDTKSNILTVNEEVELHGVGEARDELDLMTGEVVQSVGEIVLDGSDDEEWRLSWGESENYIGFQLNANIPNVKGYSPNQVSNLLPRTDYSALSGKDYEWFVVTNNNTFNLKIAKNRLISSNVDGLKRYLSINPLIAQYQLAEKTIKTVELNIQDQDGKTLSTIKPIEGKMFLSTSSDAIKPLFSGEIPVEAITQNLASFIDLEMEE